MKFLIRQVVVFLFTVFSFSAYASTSQQIYLSRHAEKHHDGSADPSLTSAGLQRSENLAILLKSKNISVIYSTNYKRTKQTAAASAKLLNLEVQIYDPRDLQQFANLLKTLKGNALVIGHSNTTPMLVNLLGGDAKGVISEDEFDRLYQLSFSENKVETKLMRTKLNNQ